MESLTPARKEHRIALISDIHANWLALKTVLEHAKGQKVHAIWNLGDFLGYSPFPNQVIETLRKKKAVSIVGNYDLKVLDFAKMQRQWIKIKHPAKYFSFGWTYGNLKTTHKRYLRGLSHEKRIKVGTKKILFVHGSPRDIDEELTKDMPLSHFEDLSRTVKEDIVLFGHTHEFFVKRTSRVIFINPGSVGRPFDGDPRASYAVLVIKGDDIEVKNYRLVYDLGGNIKAMRERGFPNDLVRSISEGRAIEDLR